jgi:hypothetical protein
LYFGKLGGSRADLPSLYDLAKRAGDALAGHIQQLADCELRREAVGFFGRQTYEGAVFEQYAVQIAARPVELRFDVTVRLHGLSCAASAGWPGVDDGEMRGIIRDRYRLDQRDRPCLEAPHGNLVAGLDREHELSAEMRRQMHLGTIVEDQAIDLAAWGQAILRDLALDRRVLLGVINGDSLPERDSARPRNYQSGRKNYVPCFHLTLRGVSTTKGKGYAIR